MAKQTTKGRGIPTEQELLNKARQRYTVKGDKIFETVENKMERKLRLDLLGSQIVAFEYMSEQEAKDLGWYHRPLIIRLARHDGSSALIVPQMDDEGNDGGALFVGMADKSYIAYTM